MNPITVFEQNFRTAEILLSLYKLLLEDKSNNKAVDFETAVRKCLSISDAEETIVLLNDLTHALFRGERANVSASFFKDRSLSLLLRQAIVAACTAMETYMNDIIRENLTKVLLKRKRNAPKKLLEINITLDDYLSIQSFDPPEERLKQLILSKYERATLANINGINECFKLLGIENCWDGLEQVTGQNKRDIMNQVESIVKRRNDIVHRGDRLPNPDINDAEIQEINFAWTHTHIQTIHNIVLASDKIINEHIKTLMEAPEA
jgi:hypothetical protein